MIGFQKRQSEMAAFSDKRKWKRCVKKDKNHHGVDGDDTTDVRSCLHVSVCRAIEGSEGVVKNESCSYCVMSNQSIKKNTNVYWKKE